MIHVLTTSIGCAVQRGRQTGIVASCLAAGLAVLWALMPTKPAIAADPAVVFMAQVGRELMAAARTRSPSVMANVINKYGDVRGIGDYSLGPYRNRLAEADREAYYAGMVNFIARYASSVAPQNPVSRVDWESIAVRGSGGAVLVDSTVTVNGTGWNVRWVLRKVGSTYKVRDAEVLGVGLSSYLKDAFQDHIAKNGGSTRALVAALTGSR